MGIATGTYFSCYSDREEFDEEKEPDGMVLSGWTQPSAEKNKNEPVGNGENTSNALPAEETENATGKKRKLSDVSKATTSHGSGLAESGSHNQPESLDEDDDDLIMSDDLESLTKKKRFL